MNNKIAVLLGGRSSERTISLQSGHAVLNSLLKSKLNAYPIDTRDYSLMQLKKEGFDKIYIALHGKNGEDGCIQGVLEYLNLPYTGSGIMASSIAIDKFRTKLLWKSSGLSTAPDMYMSKKMYIELSYNLIIKKILKLGLPVLIKPNRQGSSIGITLVSCISEINKAINIAFCYDNEILIEKFIQGKEYTVSILGKRILPSIRVSTKNHFYDYDAKYLSSNTEYLCPSGLDVQQETELKKLVITAWNIIGCIGCGRIDVILDKKNKFWLLEVNTIPGMTRRSLLPMSAKSDGISFEELVLSILNTTS